MKSPLITKKVFAWALYDWANSSFATTVMVVFFPLFFKQYLTADQDATTSTFWLGIANGVSSFVLAVMAPWLGAMADRGSAHLRFLAAFTAIGVIPTAMLAFVGVGQWQAAALLFAVASLGFWGGLIFYDSMLVKVAPPKRIDSVSGFGYALGYLGGALLLTVNVLMFAKPAMFGLASPEQAIRVSFVSVAVWWSLFAIPIFRAFPRTEDRAPIGAGRALREGFQELVRTFKEIRKFRAVILFLLAYWMYIDGVNTIMKMAVDYGLALGFPADSLISGILMIQFIGFPATLLFGALGDRISPLVGIFVGIGVYAAVTFYAVFMTSVSEFYVMAAAIGCVQGAVQAMSRSYYGRLVPAGRAGEFFGFYNMMGKFAAVLGPFLMGFTALLTGNSRMAILSVALLFAGGAIVLVFAARATRGATPATGLPETSVG
ncbi:MFS transporter [Steroidobacter sp. S1-65]|uniref:MFS transporter n=1 Tax=Steroidobacter gossypii TaxID=2805490 RepID=A0ABS1X679_9GAMM|nr:MFS transporter [Steroidobacter gossypii]MBM0108732.1 MFS transporter [Steroidobacter gossypii]